MHSRLFKYCLLTIALTGGCGAEDDPNAGAGVPGHGFNGVLKTEADEILGGTTVMACMATTCLFAETDSAGRFAFDIEAPAEVAFKTHADLDRVPRLGATLHPVRIEGDVLMELDAVYVPYLPEGVRLGSMQSGPQILLVGDGLELTLSRGELVPSLGEVLVDVAARQVPSARLPRLPDLGSEQVVAMYALHPFGTKSLSPIAVRASSSLPPGTRVNFRTISEIDGTLSSAVPGEADGTAIHTDAGAGILAMTWLVISR